MNNGGRLEEKREGADELLLLATAATAAALNILSRLAEVKLGLGGEEGRGCQRCQWTWSSSGQWT